MPQISEILRQFPRDCRPSHVEPLGSAGGMSGAQFWRTICPRGTLALRRWPTEHPAPERLRFIHAVLHSVSERGITFLPAPILARDGNSFVEHAGHLWELTPWMPGQADYERSPSVEKLRAAMVALGKFHVATSDFDHPSAIAATQWVAGPPPAIERRLARLRELAQGGIAQLERAIDDTTWPEFALLARQFIALLPRAVPPAIARLEPLAKATLPIQPCIRDIWHDHVLFTGNEVTGLIDFGALDFDSPATDIARLLGSLVGGDASGWQTGLAAYSEVRPLSRNESRAVIALDDCGILLAGCNWIRWVSVDRRHFENHAQIIERFRKIVERASFAVQPRSSEIV
jgi:homoserine kinase type II